MADAVAAADEDDDYDPARTYSPQVPHVRFAVPQYMGFPTTSLQRARAAVTVVTRKAAVSAVLLLELQCVSFRKVFLDP